ncbi:MAG: hypothetical protein AAFP69_12660 [Planctomycetota bacterium]
MNAILRNFLASESEFWYWPINDSDYLFSSLQDSSDLDNAITEGEKETVDQSNSEIRWAVSIIRDQGDVSDPRNYLEYLPRFRNHQSDFEAAVKAADFAIAIIGTDTENGTDRGNVIGEHAFWVGAKSDRTLATLILNTDERRVDSLSDTGEAFRWTNDDPIWLKEMHFGSYLEHRKIAVVDPKADQAKIDAGAADIHKACIRILSESVNTGTTNHAVSS